MQTNSTSNKIKTNNYLDNYGIIRNLARFAIPTFILTFALFFNTIIDTVMVVIFTKDYYTLGTSDSFSVGASLLSLATPFISIFASFLYIIAIGTSIMYASSLGKQDSESEIKSLLQQSFVGSILFSFFLFVIMLLMAPIYTNYILSFSTFFSAQKNFYQTELVRYILIMGLNFLLLSLTQNFLRTVRLEGHIKQATIIASLPIFFNVGLNYLFMGVFNYGITGAAFATLISTLISFVIFLIYTKTLIKKKQTNLTFNFTNFKFDGQIWLLFLFGSASVLRRIMGSFDQAALMITTINLNPIGNYPQEMWATFFNAVFRINVLFTSLALAISQSASQMIAYYSSKQEHTKVKKTLFAAFGTIVIVQTSILLFSLGFERELLNIFGIHSVQYDDQLNHVLFISFAMLSLGFLFESFIFVPNAYFNATKQPKKSYILVLLTRGLSFFIWIIVFWLIYQSKSDPEPYLFFSFAILNGVFTFMIVVPYTFYSVIKKERTHLQEKAIKA